MINIFITLSDIIELTILSIIVLIVVIGWIKNIFDKKFKQNCFKCKHYYLQDVAGAGDCCWYNCKIHSEYHKDRHSMNDDFHYRKCKDFEKEK